MQIERIIGILMEERERLNRAIEALNGSARASSTAGPAPRKRGRMSAAARKAVSERMRAYWAAKRKQKSK